MCPNLQNNSNALCPKFRSIWRFLAMDSNNGVIKNLASAAVLMGFASLGVKGVQRSAITGLNDFMIEGFSFRTKDPKAGRQAKTMPSFAPCKGAVCYSGPNNFAGIIFNHADPDRDYLVNTCDSFFGPRHFQREFRIKRGVPCTSCYVPSCPSSASTFKFIT